MELVVNYDKGTPKHKNEFEIVIEFMENDADGYQYERTFFHKEKLLDDTFKNELKEYLICLTECVKRDSRGRGGIDNLRGLFKTYGEIPNWFKYALRTFEYYEFDDLEDYIEITEEEYEKLWENISQFSHELPTYDYSGFYTSYCDLNIYYYDENGDKFPVEVIF